METYQFSKRGVLRKGDRFRVGGGPRYRGQSIGMRGLFEFRSAYRNGQRTYVEAVQIEDGQVGPSYVLHVAGPPRVRRDLPGWRGKPYTIIRRVRSMAAAN